MRLLFIEDHPHFARIVVQEFLAGHEVTLAASLEEARAHLPAGGFDAVLVDYDLPDGKGDAFVGDLRAAGFAGLVVGVSAREEGNERLLVAGADTVCPKGRFHTVGTILEGSYSTTTVRGTSVAPQEGQGAVRSASSNLPPQ